MNKTLALILVLSAMLTTACAKNVNGVQPPPGVGGNPAGDKSPTIPNPPVGAVEVSTTFAGNLGCSGSVGCYMFAQFDLSQKGENTLVVNSNNLVTVSLPNVISNGCQFVDGETCTTNLLDNNSKSSITLKGANSKSCTYHLLGSPDRYEASKSACTIEVDYANPKVYHDVVNETALRITLNYLVWE